MKLKQLLKVLLGVVLIGSASGPFAVAEDMSHPLCNGQNKTWQFAFDEKHGHKGNLAIRLVVEPKYNPEPGKVLVFQSGVTLYCFDKLDQANKKYTLRSKGGEIKLQGSVEAAPHEAANGMKPPYWKKAALKFAFAGMYFDEKDRLRIVKVNGVYYTGKMNRSGTDVSRADDRISIFISDSPFDSKTTGIGALAVSDGDLNAVAVACDDAMRAKGQSLPCDESDPADVATEETYTGAPTEFSYEEFSP